MKSSTEANVSSLLELLVRLLEQPDARRSLIEEFQRRVWESQESLGTECVDQILRDLAHDFDFYEPNETLRQEDESYYGDERLLDEVSTAIIRLKQEGMQLPRRF